MAVLLDSVSSEAHSMFIFTVTLVTLFLIFLDHHVTIKQIK